MLGTATTCQKKTTLYLYFQFGISVFVSLLVLEVMPVTLCVFVSRLRIAAIFHQHGMCSIQFKGYTMSCTQCIVCRLKCVLCNFLNFNLWFIVFFSAALNVKVLNCGSREGQPGSRPRGLTGSRSGFWPELDSGF